MTKDQAIAIILTFWVKDEWQYVYTNEAVATKVAEALTAVSGVEWFADKVTSKTILKTSPNAYGISPRQQVEWVQLRMLT